MDISHNTDVCYVYDKLAVGNWLLTSLAVLLALLATLTLLANGTILVAMFQTVLKNDVAHRVNNHNNNSYITKLLMLSMTVAGVLVGAFIMPLALVELVSNGAWTLGHSLYVVRIYGDYLLCSVASSHNLFMALETYLVVCRPLVYRLLTARAGYVMIAVSWSLPTFIVLMCSFIHGDKVNYCYDNSNYCNYFYNLKILNLICGVLFVCLFAAVWALYLVVLNKVLNFGKKNFMQIFQINERVSIYIQHATMASTSASNIEEISRTEANTAQHGTSSKRKSRTNLKCFRFVGSILMCFSLCWLPAWIVQLAFTPCRTDLPEWIYIILDWLTYISLTINPILYCSNKSVKLAVRNLICPLSFRSL